MITTSFIDIYNEAISISDSRKLKLNRRNSGAYNIDILNKVFGNKDRIVLNIDITNDDMATPLFNNVFDILCYNFNVTMTYKEYKKGICYDINDKNKLQPKRIGKLLNKLIDRGDETAEIAFELLESFKTDPERKLIKNKYLVIISRHPYDIAGMSTDRNWDSCMNLGLRGIEYDTKKQSYKSFYINRDIKYGSIIAYLVNDEDRHSNGKLTLRRPISRIVMKPYKNENGEYAYSMGKMYGASPNKFHDFIKKWLLDNINTNITGKYHQVGPLYDDNDHLPGFTINKSYHAQLAERSFRDALIVDDKYNTMFDTNVIVGDNSGDGLIFTYTITIPYDDGKKMYVYTENSFYKDATLRGIANELFHNDNQTFFTNMTYDPTAKIFIFTFTIEDKHFRVTAGWTEEDEYSYWDSIMTSYLYVNKIDYIKLKKAVMKYVKDKNK